MVTVRRQFLRPVLIVEGPYLQLHRLGKQLLHLDLNELNLYLPHSVGHICP